jgi:hypothetical protein
MISRENNQSRRCIEAHSTLKLQDRHKTAEEYPKDSHHVCNGTVHGSVIVRRRGHPHESRGVGFCWHPPGGNGGFRAGQSLLPISRGQQSREGGSPASGGGLIPRPARIIGNRSVHVHQRAGRGQSRTREKFRFMVGKKGAATGVSVERSLVAARRMGRLAATRLVRRCSLNGNARNGADTSEEQDAAQEVTHNHTHLLTADVQNKIKC